jgi:hypothetical protein
MPAAIVSSLLVIGVARESAAVTAVSVDELCAADADPCLIEQVVDVSGGTTLDFGARTLRITGAGQLRFGSGSPTVRSQRLEVAVAPDHPAIVVSASDETGKRSPYLSSGSMDIDGGLELHLGYEEYLMLQVFGDVVLRGATTISNSDPDLGELRIRSTGSVSLLGTFQTDGGGILDVGADGDVNVGGEIAMDGVRDDAGWLILEAGRDITVSSDIRVRSSAAGHIGMEAGRDVHIQSSAGSPTNIDAGALSTDQYGGDILIYAAGELDIDREASILNPADFSILELDGIKRIELLGSIVGGGRGDTVLQVVSLGDIHIGPSARIEAVMGYENGGWIGVGTFGDLEMEGAIVVSGDRHERYTDYGIVLEACKITLGAQSIIDNSIENSINVFTAHHVLEADDGASVTSRSGRNVILVRDEESSILHGSVFDPAAEVDLVPDLTFCAHCALGQSECDDGIACTADHCEGENCVGVGSDAACDDGQFCNGTETCNIENGCVPGAPVDCSVLDSQCSWGFCDEETDGCSTYPTYTECDDQDPCTLYDRCRDQVCKGRRDVACGDCGNSIVDWGEDCDDGEARGSRGDACAADCQFARCGYPVSPPFQWPRIIDALYVLKASVGLAPCAVRVCDVDGDLQIETADALLVLQTAVQIRVLPCWN